MKDKNPNNFYDIINNSLKKDPSAKLACSLIRSKCDAAHLDPVAAYEMLAPLVDSWEFLAPISSKKSWQLLGDWRCSVMEDLLNYLKIKKDI